MQGGKNQSSDWFDVRSRCWLLLNTSFASLQIAILYIQFTMHAVFEAIPDESGSLRFLASFLQIET
jgi:hypothetical protein